MSSLRKVKDAIPNFELKDSYINLEIRGDFKSFTEFYSTSKNVIFEKVVDLFNGLLIPENTSLTLTIYTTIDGFKWDSDLIVSRNEKEMLMKSILPYFESVENYEKCSEIIKIHKELSN